MTSPYTGIKYFPDILYYYNHVKKKYVKVYKNSKLLLK